MLGDDWPSPPTWQYLLLENPWPVAATALLVAIALFVVGGRRGQAKLQYAALVVFLIGASVVMLARTVMTERETLMFKTREIVHGFADPFEGDRIQAQLASDVRLFNWQVGSMMPAAEAASQQVEVTRYFIRDVRVDQDGPYHARTGVAVLGRMKHQMGENAFTVHAIFHWRRQPDGQWQLYHVPNLWLNQQDAEDVVRDVARF